MNEVDPGHEYLLDSYDGGDPVRLVYVKREGEGYPFNVGHHPGTNCQEVIRALIARVKYLQKQVRCDENIFVIDYLRRALWQFEIRAAQRHGRRLPDFYLNEIENQPTCAGCGHIGCEGNHKFHAAATPLPETPHHKHCSIWTVTTSGEKRPCDCVCQCTHSMFQHVRPGEHYWYEDCAVDDCPCMKFVAAPVATDDVEGETQTAMKPGDTVRFVRDGEQYTATIISFAPRVFGGAGCNIETTKGWVLRDDIDDWTPAAALRTNVEGEK